MNSKYRNEGLDLKRVGLFFQKRIWIVILMALIGAGIGALGYQVVKSINMPIEYKAVSKFYIRFNVDENGQVYQYYNGYTWNELIDADPMMECIMGYLPGYDAEDVKNATTAEILSDIRLLTVTVTGRNEKFVREIQSAVESGLAGYATLDNDLNSITAIRTIAPERVFWSDKTLVSAVFGAIIVGIVTFVIFAFRYVLDDSIYVQSDLEKRYDYKALGLMTRNQKGLQPYFQELKANILYSLKDERKLILVDIDDHAELRAQDVEKILNWEEGGELDGLGNVVGSLVWHTKEEDEDKDLFDIEEESEWTIIPVNSFELDENNLENIKKAGGAIILVPFGASFAVRRLERVISLFKNQDINIYGIVITEADEEYLARYYS